MLPLAICNYKVKVWVPLGYQPKNEWHFYQSSKRNVNCSLVMETQDREKLNDVLLISQTWAHTRSQRALVTKPWIGAWATGKSLLVVNQLLLGISQNTHFHPEDCRKPVLILSNTIILYLISDCKEKFWHHVDPNRLTSRRHLVQRLCPH